MHDPQTDLSTVPAIPIHPAVIGARVPLGQVVTDLLAIGDERLEGPWRWRPTDHDDVDVRYGVYRIHERLEQAIGAISVGRAERPGEPIGPAIPALAALAAARWELRGTLEPLAEADWDADPGDGEWTIRQTVGHIISGQRGYALANAWFLSRPVTDGEVAFPPDGSLPPLPEEEEESAGSPAVVLARIDEVVDASIAANAGLEQVAMGVAARWWGQSVTIDFRLGRYGSHVREHTVQVDKTLAMLDRRPPEAERLARLILASYGRLEGLLVGRPATELERHISDGSSAIAILDEAMTDVVATAASVRSAAAA
jgi:hypothetical protein